MSFHIFGIRHHGPGSARSLRAALETLDPDCILVEGPPDAQAVLPLLAQESMHPPVALLVYAPDAPQHAVYYPFTHFSPEWQALRYAHERSIPARLFDLPQAIQFARAEQERAREQAIRDTEAPDQSTEATAEPGDMLHDAATMAQPDVPVRDDPLALLAQAAGYADHELWWEQQIEQHQGSDDIFAGILEAMTELRSRALLREEEALREAHMRTAMREAQAQGYARIAVVCGAWHGPALGDLSGAKADAALLKGLPKVPVSATWIPWTNSRLAYRSGYGAGVTSPGWYAHLWHTAPHYIAIRWMTLAAHQLRAAGIDASSASVIEAVRLSEALAAMRELSMPGLAEMHEAVQTVLCNGADAPMQLIRDKLEIGEAMGEVPPETPTVPLQRDLELRQKRLRLKPSPVLETPDYDLRKDTDRARSQLLHQLRLLGIEWGKPQRVYGSSNSTFHERWQLQWQVEFAVDLIEKNIWGNTVELAATGYVEHLAATAKDLPTLTDLLDRAILAELHAAVDHLLERVQTLAAISADMRHLMDALPPLAHIARYGNVRGTRAEQIMPVIAAIFERVVIGLPNACSSLDDDAATSMVASIDHAQESIDLLNDQTQRDEWHTVLAQLIDRDGVHGLVRGRCCRLLLEHQTITEDELQILARRALSPALPAAQAAAWVEGVLHGSGLLLIHQDGLWLALDAWLSDLDAATFVALLPLVRRAFAEFQPPERRAMGDKVKHLRQTGQRAAPITTDSSIDSDHADRVLPILAQILGVELR